MFLLAALVLLLAAPSFCNDVPKVLDICTVAPHLESYADKVIAIRGRITEVPDSREPGSFYVYELTGRCRFGTARSVKTVRIALFEWSQKDGQIPNGHRLDADSINQVDKSLVKSRKDARGGSGLVTVTGVLLVGEDRAAEWVRRTGRSDMFVHRPYAAELAYFNMKDFSANSH